MKTIRDILNSESPTDFRTVEQALATQKDRCREAEAALSALILLRRTQGGNGLMDALVSADCAARLKVLDAHLDEIGAHEAADTIREVKARLPDSTVSSAGEIFEVLDRQPEFLRFLDELEDTFDGIEEPLEDFLRKCPEHVLAAEARTARSGFFTRLRSHFS